MRFHSSIIALLGFTMVSCGSQTPSESTQPGPAPQADQSVRVVGDLAQVMRGILFPNSNIIFDAQNTDPVTPGFSLK